MDEEYLKVYSKCTEGERGRAGNCRCCKARCLQQKPCRAAAPAVATPKPRFCCLRPSPWLAAEAQKLAQQFSNTEFISKLLPESGVLEALKKVVPMALKLVV